MARFRKDMGVSVSQLSIVCNAREQHVLHDGEVYDAIDFLVVVVAVGRLNPAAELVRWPGCLQQDVAAHRVLSKERALRPPQHLDIFEVEEQTGSVVLYATIDSRQRNFVEKHGHARLNPPNTLATYR